MILLKRFLEYREATKEGFGLSHCETKHSLDKISNNQITKNEVILVTTVQKLKILYEKHENNVVIAVLKNFVFVLK